MSDVNLSDAQRDLAALTYSAILEYGATSDASLLDSLQPLYRRCCQELPQTLRLAMLNGVIEKAVAREMSMNGFMPFLFFDPDPMIISTASLNAAELWSTASAEDPYAGVREIADYVRQTLEIGEEERSVALLSGLLLLGDRAVVEQFPTCWAPFSSEGRRSLAATLGHRPFAALVDFLVGWMEQCEGGEFGAVAGSLARLATIEMYPGVVEVRRIMPSWVAPSEDEVMTTVQQWSYEAYGQMLRPRLLQLAADEAKPRLMHDVLREWKIDSNHRLMGGVVRRPVETTRRPLLPLVPRDWNDLSTLTLLEDEDFLAVDGRLLLCWHVFNPYGPMLSCIGVMPSEDPGQDLVFHRLLSPTSHLSGVICTVPPAATWTNEQAEELVKRLLHQDVVLADGDAWSLFGNALPDAVFSTWFANDDPEPLKRMVFASTKLAQLDLARELDFYTRGGQRPWERATLKRNFALAHLDSEPLPLVVDKAVLQEQFDDWLIMATDSVQLATELSCLADAWHGAIDQVADTLGRWAWTYWQLDDFLTRYGSPYLRLIAKMRTDAEGRLQG